jgi:antitoxin component of RelBE/YafQ-DinJ toxin-antitoxin module
MGFIVRQDNEYSDSNTNFNFRCNDKLKEDFKRLCKNNQMPAGTALKLYMLKCLKEQKVV